MPSSFSFLLNSSSSSSESDSKSDETDDDDDDEDINIGYYKKRTIQNDNDMLECPSDNGDSRSNSESDVTDDEKENDHIPPLYDPHSHLLPRQLTLYEDDDQWTKRTSRREEAVLFQQEPDDLICDLNPHRLFSPERSQSVSIVDKTYQSRHYRPLSPSDFATSARELRLLPEPESPPMPTPLSKTLASPIRVPIKNEDTRRPITKIPIRTNSSSPSRSRSPAVPPLSNRRVLSPTGPSRIPVPISTMNKGAFHFFTADDRPSSKLPSTGDSTQTAKQLSPFTPISTHRKTLPLAKKSSSSAGNTPSLLRHRQVPVPSSDEEEDVETNNLKEDDLKLKLKEQKRHGKQTGEILNKLHENYEELLEKYAQAENTIDQLRFQPKFFGENSPPFNTAEGVVHFIQQPKVNTSNLRSSGVYHSTSDTPISSIRQVPSTTTTTTTPIIKSTSPANSGTVESVFFDEPTSQKIVVQELTSPESLKLDLLIQTKTLSEKMKSFLTLMDANQLSLAEQKQVYESIKDDYEKLLKTFDRTKRGDDLNDIDLDADLNQQLEMMKQLLKEIVKRITDNLLGKSSNGSETGRQSRLTRDGSQSSQLSVRSSLCNHADLMEQYQKLLSAVNTGTMKQKSDIKPSGIEQLKKTISRDSSQSNASGHRRLTSESQKPCVYVSGNSEDEPEQRNYCVTPIRLRNGIEAASFDLDYVPSKASKYHQQVDEQQTHIHGSTMAAKKKKLPLKRSSQEYDNLDNISKTKRKTKADPKKITNHYQAEKDLSPSSLSMPTGHNTRYSTSSMRTRTSDYDSGIGTNNTTKLSRDSKLNTSTMDESQYQSLDEEQRRYSDEEQESMSSRSSGSDADNLESLHSKYAKRFGSTSSLKRRKPSGHSDVYSSDVETHITGSFDPLPTPSSYSQERTRRSHHSWQPQRTDSHYRSRLTASHRSISRERDLDQSYPHRPQTAPQISSTLKMAKQYQSGFVHHQTTARHPPSRYQSSFYIDQSHTHRRSQERLNPPKYEPTQTPARKPSNNLYLDSRTGTIYRYVPTRNEQPTSTTVKAYPPVSQVKSSRELYQCGECGSVTTYQHRHHIDPHIRRIGTDVDDPGYESGNRKLNQHRRYLDRLTSSDSDPDETRFEDLSHGKSTSFDITSLNEAYERARKVQHRSQNLSKHISRQLKLVLATM